MAAKKHVEVRIREAHRVEMQDASLPIMRVAQRGQPVRQFSEYGRLADAGFTKQHECADARRYGRVDEHSWHELVGGSGDRDRVIEEACSIEGERFFVAVRSGPHATEPSDPNPEE